jgi:hypothetical protein
VATKIAQTRSEKLGERVTAVASSPGLYGRSPGDARTA